MSAPTQDFSQRELNWMRKWRSQAHLRAANGTRPTSREEWRSFLSSVADRIANDDFHFHGLSRKRRNGKWLVWTSVLEEVLVLRKINDNIRRSYAIRQQNRSSLIRTAKQALSENTPKTVARIDIKSCFESINLQLLIRSMRLDGKVSAQTIVLLERAYEQSNLALRSKSGSGIPRGVNVSTSLAEIALSQLDSRIRQIPGTYLVLRYVDDILVFSTANESRLMEQIKESAFAVGMRLNPAKSRPFRIGCACDPQCQHNGTCPCFKACICHQQDNQKQLEIEFLGYKLVVSNRNATKSTPNLVACVFSDKKIRKVKTRISLAIGDYLKTNDLALLIDRIRFLADNQLLGESPTRNGLYSGNSYSYAEYDNASNFMGTGRVEDIDVFYKTQVRRLIKSKNSTLPQLSKISFRSGLLHKRRTKFSALRVVEITKCWSA